MKNLLGSLEAVTANKAAVGKNRPSVEEKIVMRKCITISDSLLRKLTMTTLTVTARGQVTFRKEVLQHLGIKPGGKIELDFLPDGRCVLTSARSTGTIDGFIGLLAGQTRKVATLAELDAAVAQAWAGKE